MGAKPGPVLALAGGVGGAKLALGLTHSLPPQDLVIVVNTGDDEEFHGLHVSPDLDTVMYTLSGLADPGRGWGLSGETFQALKMLSGYGVPTWFNLGDRDLATHIRRTQLLREGRSLSEATRELCGRVGISYTVSPMTDDRVRTKVETSEGVLAFQDYFVRRRCEPEAKAVRFEGADASIPSPTFDEALNNARAIVFCPSNPFLSIDPILAVGEVRERIRRFNRPRIVVSPIVGGAAIRGPAAKMMRELGHPVSSVGVARKYAGLCDHFVIDNADADEAQKVESLGMKAHVANTIMHTLADKATLARYVLEIVDAEGD